MVSCCCMQAPDSLATVAVDEELSNSDHAALSNFHI